MGDLGVRVDIQELLSFGDDLIGVLRNKKDSESLMQAMEGAKMLGSSYRGDAHDTQIALEEYQKMINALKEKIDMTRNETVADSEIENLQNELGEKFRKESSLRQELRGLSEECDDLKHQRISIEERKELVKKREKDLLRAQNVLSMCASVTKLIPNLDDQTKISCYLVERNKKKAEKFETESSISPFEATNRLWKIVDCD